MRYKAMSICVVTKLCATLASPNQWAEGVALTRWTETVVAKNMKKKIRVARGGDQLFIIKNASSICEFDAHASRNFDIKILKGICYISPK